MKFRFLIIALSFCCAVWAGERSKPDRIVIHLSGSVSSIDSLFIPFYTPFEVPESATRISVTQKFSTPSGERTNLDMGVFDSRGKGLNGAGFRGWSGGARRYFEISVSEATPGYIPGEIPAGEWNVVQMATTRGIPRTDRQLEIVIETGGKKEAPFVKRFPTSSLNNTPGWYRIDTHVHSVHSDGTKTPAELVELGKAAGLDGIISTDHNTISSLPHWGEVQRPDFLVIPGMEVTYEDGHWNVFNIKPDTWIDFRFSMSNGCRPSYFETVMRAKANSGFVSANHPYSIIFRYDKTPMDGIEVWNGPWQISNEKALEAWNSMLVNSIFKVAVGGSDYHRDGNTLGTAQTVVQSESLSADAVTGAISKGRCYVAKNLSVTVSFFGKNRSDTSVCCHLGDEMVLNENSVFEFQSNCGGLLQVYNQNGLICHEVVAPNQVLTQSVPLISRWIRAELRDSAGNMLALTNPIFCVDKLKTIPML